jgi:hypothetical protein
MIQVSYCDPRYLLGSYPMWVNRDMGRSFSRRKRRARQVPRKANQVGRAYQGPSLTPVDVVTSHSLTSYWPHVEYIPTRWHPIGPTWSIIPLAGVLLAPRGINSLSLAFYWPLVEYIPTPWYPIGPTWIIFPLSGFLVEYIPTLWLPIGPTWSIFPISSVLLAPQLINDGDSRHP